jgi:hypothetical protein
MGKEELGGTGIGTYNGIGEQVNVKGREMGEKGRQTTYGAANA